jgi:AcrR family transcriptional regulator
MDTTQTQPAASPPQISPGGRKKALTKAEILEAAASIIIASGFEGCTMRAVAARVGMKAGSIYYHFSSKDQIVEAILNIGIETLYDYVTAELGKLPEDAAFERKLRVATAAHLHSLIGPDIRYLQVYDHLPPILKRKSRKMRGKYAKLWYDMFADGVWRNQVDTSVNLRILVPYYLGALNRVPEWLHVSGNNGEEVVALAVNTLLRGVGLG